jgi:hypothetical protein
VDLQATSGVANGDLALTPKGTGTVVANGPFTATGQTELGGSGGGAGLRVVPVASSDNPWILSAGRAGVQGGRFTTLSPSIQSTDSAPIDLRTNAGAAGGSGLVQARIAHTSNAVNFVQVTGAATGGAVGVTAQGSDANVGMSFSTKGSFNTSFRSGGGSWIQFVVNGANNSVNYLSAAGSVANQAPILSSVGSDTNISQVFQSKGTGAINLAPGSSGVNISNGGTVTALTMTAGGSGYTSIPAVTIAAPTTAGGATATSTTPVMLVGSGAIALGGTGYTVNDVLTGTNGTFSTPYTVTVTSVSGGVITGFTATNGGSYTVLPTGNITMTGGTGSGATFSATYAVRSIPITTAGSGYVEQPTVTFSGGGGSGAAAVATVGAGVSLRSLGGGLSFLTPLTGEAFRVYDFGGVTWVGVRGHTGPTAPAIFSAGSANVGLDVASNGSGPVSIRTGGNVTNNGIFNQVTQLNVTHTASAVNFVQVTGAATGGRAIISTQGSDASPALDIVLKGTPTGPGLRIQNQGGAGTCFGVVASAASVVNYLQVVPSTTGFGPSVRAAGSDTNIPLVLQPQGTGALQAQLNDGTATGGNARGANAVDWQTVRNTAAQVASGASSTICGGSSNTSSAFFSVVAGGAGNIASANYSFVGAGANNTASGGVDSYSGIVTGYSNTAAGRFNFIGGGFGNSGTASAAVTTQSATMNGTTAVTLSGSNANIRVGQLIAGTNINSFPPTYVAAISGTSLTLSQVASGSGTATLSFFTPHGVVVGGGNNQATGAYSFVGGGGDAGTATNRNRASGDWSFVGGGGQNTASGIGSVVVGGGSFGSGFAGNTANGTSAAVVAGYLNQATGFGTFIGGGNSNIANNNFGAIFGGAQGTTRSLVGNHVFPACSSPIASVQGVSQASLLVLARQTTDATPTVLCSDTSAAGTLNQVTIPNNAAYHFRGSVIANVTGAANGAAWSFEGAIMRGANAASTVLIGAPVVNRIAASAGATAWTIAVTADTTNGGLAVTVTGAASTTIRWVAKLETTEVTF